MILFVGAMRWSNTPYCNLPSVSVMNLNLHHIAGGFETLGKKPRCTDQVAYLDLNDPPPRGSKLPVLPVKISAAAVAAAYEDDRVMFLTGGHVDMFRIATED